MDMQKYICMMQKLIYATYAKNTPFRGYFCIFAYGLKHAKIIFALWQVKQKGEITCQG